jgi:hypothetical protein
MQLLYIKLFAVWEALLAQKSAPRTENHTTHKLANKAASSGECYTNSRTFPYYKHCTRIWRR